MKINRAGQALFGQKRVHLNLGAKREKIGKKSPTEVPE